MTPGAVHNVTFHGVGVPPRGLDPGEAAVWLGTERFLEALDALCGRDEVRVSFDDGNRSDVEIALPALLERGLAATFFVVAGRLGDAHFLGGGDVRRLRAAGMAIGSHGLRHRDWRRESDAGLADELGHSRRILEGVIGAPVTRAAVPFGSYDRRVLTRARRDGGYAQVFTSDGGPARQDAWLQPRSTVGDDGALPQALIAPPRARATAARTLKGLVKRWR